jgi:hypothetical protein
MEQRWNNVMDIQAERRRKMGTWLRIIVLAICLVLVEQGFSFAEEKKWFEDIHASGFVDAYYSYNFNNPGDAPGGLRQNGIGGLRNFDTYNDQFALSLAELVFSKDAAPLGFRVDLDYGPTTELVHCGVVTCPGGTPEEPFKTIQQAYLSWKPSSMWTIDAGKFVTHMGYEVIESKDNWNYSRSNLFMFAIPYYHSGVRISHAHENFWLTGYIYNGWNNVVENNAGKTFGATLGLTPLKGLTVIQQWIGGPEPVGLQNRHVLDSIVTFSPMDMLSLALNYDYGWQKTDSGDNQIWTGIAAYARIAPTDKLAFIPRVEWYDDKYGLLNSGTRQIMKEVTLTGEYKLYDSLLTRLEYRSDWSTADMFASDTSTTPNTKSQDTITLGVVYMF